MSEKKSRKELRKAQKAALEKEKLDNSLEVNNESESLINKKLFSIQDLLASSGIDCTHFDYL